MVLSPRSIRNLVLVSATGVLALGCSDGSGPSRDPAFITGASSYTLQEVEGVPRVTINYTFMNTDTELAALQGCQGGPAWWLEKRVGNSWREAYPAHCEPNPDLGIPVSGGEQYSGTVSLSDGPQGGPDPRFNERPVAGTYRLRFGLFDRVNQNTGIGTRVTDGRQYSNTFTLQD